MSGSTSIIEISIIVCCHKQDFIERFMHSVYCSAIETHWELIIMDGEGLPAKKRNDAVKKANGRYLAFFDDDVEVDPLCIQTLYNKLKEYEKRKRVLMVYGKLWKADEKPRLDEAGSFLTNTGFLWSRAEQNIVDKGQFDSDVYVLAGKSASCMVNRDAFEAVGGFDEEFGILGEETDLSWRLWLIGGTVMFIPSATGVHYFNTKFKPSDHYSVDRVFYNGCRNYITMLVKNLGLWRLCWMLPIHIGVWFTAGLLKILTGKFSHGWNIFRGLIYCLLHIPQISRKRRKIQKMRSVSESNLIPYILQSPKRSYYFDRFLRYVRGSLHG